jgi:hypothetical protein
VTRRILATAVLLAALAGPVAAAQEAPTTADPTVTAPGTTSTVPPPASSTTTPAAPAPAPTPAPAQTTPQPAAEDDRDTAAIALLLVVGGLLLAALVLWALARWQAWEPPWLLRWRHSTAEAGWRMGNAWSEFVDWLRLGR